MSSPTRPARRRWDERLMTVEAWVATAFLVALVVLVGTQVVTRYVLARPPVWTEETARYTLIWLTFVGAAHLAGRRRHLTVATFDRFLPPRVLAWTIAVADLVIAGLAGLLVYASIDYLERVSRQTTAAGGLPMSWVYGALTVGLALVALHCVVGAVRDLRVLLTGGIPVLPSAAEAAEEVAA
ncbi:TRAP transporter small permease [Pseudonocardia nematodicida]|uniref:TRAP transporter small permease n=1 Tax=Pseudonocardia nematodicida TaxID=1206997 RepID=A0ABV1KMC8_9PSEU